MQTIQLDISKFKKLYYRFDKLVNIEKILLEHFSYYVDKHNNYIIDSSNVILNIKFKTENKTYELKDINIFYSYNEYIKYLMTINHYISKQLLKKLNCLTFNNIYFKGWVSEDIIEYEVI